MIKNKDIDVDTSAGGLLVAEGITSPVVGVSAHGLLVLIIFEIISSSILSEIEA